MRTALKTSSAPLILRKVSCCRRSWHRGDPRRGAGADSHKDCFPPAGRAPHSGTLCLSNVLRTLPPLSASCGHLGLVQRASWFTSTSRAFELLGYACPVDEIPKGCAVTANRQARERRCYHLTRLAPFAATRERLSFPHPQQQQSPCQLSTHMMNTHRKIVLLRGLMSAHPSLMTLYEAFTGYIEYIQ